jgi:osmoprotectant transport system permease protein
MNDAWRYLIDGAHWRGSDGIATRMAEHFLLTGASLLVAMLVALPIALYLGHVGKGGVLAINISNVGRAIPTFAIMLVLSVLDKGPLNTNTFGPFGRAGFATLVALILFAIPPIMTNAYVGMREVDRDVVESALGMGMAGRQAFMSVELPLALPLIMTGVRLALVQVWATATIAALVAGPGLGNIITLGFDANKQYIVVAGAIVVATVAVLLEVGMVILTRLTDPISRAKRHRNDPIGDIGGTAEVV